MYLRLLAKGARIMDGNRQSGMIRQFQLLLRIQDLPICNGLNPLICRTKPPIAAGTVVDYRRTFGQAGVVMAANRVGLDRSEAFVQQCKHLCGQFRLVNADGTARVEIAFL